jgi:hypothetical protein
VSEVREPLCFESTISPRRALGAATLALGFGCVGFELALARETWAIQPVSAVVQLVTVFGFGAASILAALRELSRFTLRVTDRALEHVPPSWIPNVFWSPGETRVAADCVRELAWDGYDNIGLRLTDGRVVPVFYRHRIAASHQSAARLAVLAFVERATGKPLPPLDPPEVAPWLLSKPS